MFFQIHQIKFSIHKLLKLVALITTVAVSLSCGQQTDTANRDTAQEKLPVRPAPTDHSGFFNEPFVDGPAVTVACLKCHEDTAQDVMQTAHWNWQGQEVMVPGHEKPLRIGKRNVINNFCIGVQSNWSACTTCHIGYGWEDENFDFNDETRVDCLVCHDNSGTYLKKSQGAGIPDDSVDLLEAARSVGPPQRKNCGACHFQGGGGDAVKHGDMDETLLFPSSRIDIHMGKNDMQCTDCHQAKKHSIRGRSMAVSVDRENRLECTACHVEEPHQDTRLNSHTDRLACQTCHIPHMGADTGTKLSWDWSQAGQDLDITDEHIYLKIKGRFTWAKKNQPEYYWYNQTSTRYIVGDKIDPSNVTSMNKPLGDIDDDKSKIWPFKVHRGKQPYDLNNQYFLIPNVHGDLGFWTKFDWPTALDLGSEVTGLPYSGEFDFAPTEMYFPLSHMVTSVDQALQCRDCHGNQGRINWTDLGYESDPLLYQVEEHEPMYFIDSDEEPVVESGNPISVPDSCGMCHELESEEFLDTHSYHGRVQDEKLPIERKLLMIDGPRIPKNENEQMNCFLCHIPKPDYANRLDAIQSGNQEWSISATLVNTGIIKKTDNGYQWNDEQVLEDGEVNMQMYPVAEENCGACHGKVDNSSRPLVVKLGDNLEWTTEKTGQVFSPQLISQSGMNLKGKDQLNIPWDIHAQRLVSCGDCHYSRRRPERLAGEISEETAQSDERNLRRCESCHSLDGTHSWLPEQEKHFKTVTCESCHVPQLQMAAQQTIDATVVSPDGQPQLSYRGVEGDIKNSTSVYIQGYQPLLGIGTDYSDGHYKVRPYNLVTRWFWVDQATDKEVSSDILARVWLNANAYRTDILTTFDADSNGKLESNELRLDDYSKIILIKDSLRANGVQNPVIHGELRAYHIHHSIRHGDEVNRNCTRCHDDEDEATEIAAFSLSDFQPDYVKFNLVIDSADIKLDGEFRKNEQGAFEFAPNKKVAESYKSLINRE